MYLHFSNVFILHFAVLISINFTPFMLFIELIFTITYTFGKSLAYIEKITTNKNIYIIPHPCIFIHHKNLIVLHVVTLQKLENKLSIVYSIILKTDLYFYRY